MAHRPQQSVQQYWTLDKSVLPKSINKYFEAHTRILLFLYFYFSASGQAVVTGVVLLPPGSGVLHCLCVFTMDATNPNPNPNPNLEEICRRVPPNDVTGLKWLKKHKK